MSELRTFESVFGRCGVSHKFHSLSVVQICFFAKVYSSLTKEWSKFRKARLATVSMEELSASRGRVDGKKEFRASAFVAKLESQNLRRPLAVGRNYLFLKMLSSANRAAFLGLS
jgi:hypothetical protein